MGRKGSNQSLVKVINQKLIIEEIIACGHISRTELAKKLQLSNPSVSKHVDDLIGKGILIETGSLKTGVGRRPIMLEFNGKHGCVAVIDFSSNDVRICLADMLGEKLEYTRVDGGKLITGETVSRVIATMRDMLSSLKERCGGLVGICIGVPGIVDPENGKIVRSERLEAYSGGSIADEFGSAFGVPVLLNSDVNLAVIGEQIRGAGEGVDSLMFVSIDATPGLSAIIDGKLYEGRRGMACDLSSVLFSFASAGEPVADIATPIGSVLNIYALVDEVRAVIQSGRESVLREWADTPDDIFFDDIVRAYGMSDPAVMSIVRSYAKKVAIVCRNLSCLFDTELILIGGAISKLGAPFLSELTACCTALAAGSGGSEIRLSKLSDTAVIYGGIDTAVKYAIGCEVDSAH